MSDDKELQVRLQFLEEAGEYLDNMESGLLGLGSGQVKAQEIDGVLRAAHSIKGGAAMMGFQTLSHLAHRLEDFFKVLKVGKSEVDSSLESLFLASVDFLRQIIVFNRQQQEVNSQWLETTVEPIFEQLHDRLGDPQPEDAAALLSAEMGEDMSTLIFETEVEELLSRLEENLDSIESARLEEELNVAAQELSGLGEMLELPAFFSLCESVIESLTNFPEQIREIAETALAEWRRSQALVLIGQTEVLPDKIELPESTEDDFFADSSFDSGDFSEIEELPNSTVMMSLLELEESQIDGETSSLFSSLEGMLPEAEVIEPEVIPAVPIVPTYQPTIQPSAVPLTTDGKPELETPSNKTIRVATEQLEQLSDLFGEVAIERNGLSTRLKSFRNLVSLLSQRIKTLERSNSQLRVAYDRVASETRVDISTDGSTPNPDSPDYFDSLEMDNYSDIHLLSQEVMETIVQLQEVTKDLEINLDDTEKNSRELNRTTRQMQDTIVKVRMRPLSDLLDRFPRALRDLELQYGKKVGLNVRGGSTLVERSIVEALNDPLLHLFRNAFDHGIEPKSDRIAAGKPEQGTISIVASHRGNQTAISISDDGGGIDLEKIKTKAIAMGLSPEDLLQAKEQDLLDLIFEPGFSTAQEVTDLSGRGVGMDVVKTNIEQVNGTIQVETNPGQGTTFTITVPFTLSVVRVLLVESSGMLLAVPTNVVEEMMVLDSSRIVETAGQEVLNWDGLIVRLVRLHQWLNLTGFAADSTIELEQSPTIEEPTVLAIAKKEELVGIQVDRYWQEQEVTIRSVEGDIPLPPGFSGCTILGNGRVVPLVDVVSLLNWIDKDRSGISATKLKLNPSQEKETSRSATKQTIMVVDDSINVRRFLALTLEKANYRVEQAKDGQDAFDKLQAGSRPDAVICDIEMPRLDGFGFLSRVRAEKQHKALPIIMLTSRSGDKHRRLAMSLGATDYFGKPFKENLLLSTLEELIRSR